MEGRETDESCICGSNFGGSMVVTFFSGLSFFLNIKVESIKK